jgi:hemerythrin-like domain-containing protein
MKRDKSLRPLSREHHRALVTARALKEAEASQDLASMFLTFWHEDGQRHFRIEEEVLLPTWALHASVDRDGVKRMLEEHLAIRRSALEIETRGLTADSARQLGQLLEDHVRFEERELFPLVEAALDSKALSQLALLSKRLRRKSASDRLAPDG